MAMESQMAVMMTMTDPKMRKGNASKGFVDLDGDGINDNAMDDDGDGIPNGQDPDYTKPEDGTGKQNKFGSKSMNQNGKGSMNRNGSGTFGPGNGNGTGDCDGTGPKGTIKRGGGKSNNPQNPYNPQKRLFYGRAVFHFS